MVRVLPAGDGRPGVLAGERGVDVYKNNLTHSRVVQVIRCAFHGLWLSGFPEAELPRWVKGRRNDCAGSSQIGSNLIGSNQAGSNRTGSNCPGSNWAGSNPGPRIRPRSGRRQRLRPVCGPFPRPPEPRLPPVARGAPPARPPAPARGHAPPLPRRPPRGTKKGRPSRDPALASPRPPLA
jgi:hypothetical protein